MVSSQGTTSSTVSQLDDDPTITPSSLPRRPGINSHPSLTALPPLVTSTPLRSSNSQRAHPLSKNRLSTFSIASSTLRSRPQSTVYPMFHSSLPYALVRDFAYPPHHHMHYGPPPDPASAISTPASEFHRRLSDPYLPIYGLPRGLVASDSIADDTLNVGQRLPATAYRDGPPWSEDDDLQSPIVTSTKSRKGRSKAYDTADAHAQHRQNTNGGAATSYAGTNSDGSKMYYVGQSDESAGGPGGEYITYPAGTNSGYFARQRRSQDSHGGALLSDRAYHTANTYDSPEESTEQDADLDPDESRYSRNYQFTIASPDEEMHGKAVALYDFARENENELPLREGQVIWVSYRHGEGWLVAQDPKSEETGLVPEGFVRLVRDIEGGLASLNGDVSDGSPISPDAETPTLSPHSELSRSVSDRSKHYTPIVSQFTTSSKDLDPYPPHLLGSQTSPDATPRPQTDDSKPILEATSLEKSTAPEDSGTEEVRLSNKNDESTTSR